MTTTVPNVTAGWSAVPRLTQEVADVIRNAAQSGLGAAAGQGIEAGGLLMAPVGETGELVIDRIELVLFQPRLGPEYRLSLDDLTKLRTRAAELRSPDYRIVAYVRICSSGPIALVQEENAIIREALPDCRWFLMAKTFRDGRSRIRVFRVNEDSWYQAADFDLPRADEKAIGVPKREPLWLRATAVAVGVLGNVPPVVTGILSLCAIAFVAWFALHNRPMVTSTDVGLRTGVDGGMLGLTWNNAAPALKNATQATLHIDDGSRTRDVPLDPERLNAGLLLYRPQSAEVIFRLELRGGQGKTQIASARWVGRPDMLAPGDYAMRAEEAPANERTGAAQLAQALQSEAPVGARANDGLAKFVVKTPGARITIKRADDPHAQERVIAAGAFRLPAGAWIVHATAPGFKPWTERIRVTQKSAQQVLIKLHQGRG